MRPPGLRLVPVLLYLGTATGCLHVVDPNAQLQCLRKQCQAYGIKENTPDLSNCVMQADLARKQRSAISGAAVVNAAIPRP